MNRIGHYEIMDTLGSGGMGTVYRARHISRGTLRAVKTVKLFRGKNLKSLRREIHTLSQINHPGIVKIFDHGVNQGIPWYAMELLEGFTLSEWIKNFSGGKENEAIQPDSKTTPTLEYSVNSQTVPTAEVITPDHSNNRGLNEHIDGTPNHDQSSNSLNSGSFDGHYIPPLAETESIIKHLCQSLAYLHGEGIVHRDLKPHNIMMRFNEVPVITDFGLVMDQGVSSRDRIDTTSGGMGTVNYLSPEQIVDGIVDARADLYSLGCLFYEMVTGQVPFPGSTPEEIIYAHVTKDPVRPSVINALIPKDLDDLILSLLAKDPQERIGHADDVAALLSVRVPQSKFRTECPKPKAYLYRSYFEGQKESLDGLNERISRTGEAVRNIFFVGGESGIGKTRFVNELARKIPSKRMNIFEGECTHESGISLQALQKPLQEISDRCITEGAELSDLIIGKRGKVLALYQPSLRALPGQDEYKNPSELPPAQAKLRLFHYLTEVLEKIADEKPLLLILDDLHWADELTLGWLNFFMENRTGSQASIVILCTYRTDLIPQGVERLMQNSRGAQIVLNRLDENDIYAIVSAMLANKNIPVGFIRFLFDQSEGNPFFVSEYLRLALELGILWRDESGQWQITEAGPEKEADMYSNLLDLPKSIRNLIAQRLDHLPGESYNTVIMASLIGRECRIDLLQDMTRCSEKEYYNALRNLIWHNIFEETAHGTVRFTHDKIREHAYDTIDKKTLPALHNNAAEALESVMKDELDTLAGELGFHWELAGNREKARIYYLTKARQLKTQYSFEESEKMFRNALHMADEDTLESMDIIAEMAGEVLFNLGRIDDSITELSAILNSKNIYKDKKCHAKVVGNLGINYRLRGDLKKAKELFELSLSLSKEAQDRSGEGLALGNLGNLAYFDGRILDSKKHFRESLEIFRELEDPWREGKALGNLGNTLMQTEGCTEEVLSILEQALEISRKNSDRRLESITSGNCGQWYLANGKPEQAFDLFSSAFRIAEEIGDRHLTGSYLIATAEQIFWISEDSSQTEGFLEKTRDYLAEIRGYSDYTRLQALKGRLALAIGKDPHKHISMLEQMKAPGDSPEEKPHTEAIEMLKKAHKALKEGKNELLFRGMLKSDIPPEINKWLTMKGRDSLD